MGNCCTNEGRTVGDKTYSLKKNRALKSSNEAGNHAPDGQTATKTETMNKVNEKVQETLKNLPEFDSP